jgi:hypothetical protein
MANPTISKHEDALIALLYQADEKVMRSTRRSPRPYDLTIEGFFVSGPKYGISFSAWLPLAGLARLEGKAYARAVRMSDYPEMRGDWSGIRDSTPETIWRMFHTLVLKEGTRHGQAQ